MFILIVVGIACVACVVGVVGVDDVGVAAFNKDVGSNPQVNASANQ